MSQVVLPTNGSLTRTAAARTLSSRGRRRRDATRRLDRDRDTRLGLPVSSPRYIGRMGLVAYLIILFFGGLVIGALARLLVPGPDPMGIGMTALVGICGTFSAGLFSWYVLHRHGGGLVLSVLFSMLVVWIYRRSRGGSYQRQGPGGRRGPH